MVYLVQRNTQTTETIDALKASLIELLVVGATRM